jgi:hypothetical protein
VLASLGGVLRYDELLPDIGEPTEFSVLAAAGRRVDGADLTTCRRSNLV